MMRIVLGLVMFLLVISACTPGQTQPDTSSERSLYQGRNDRDGFTDTNFGDPSRTNGGPNNTIGYVRHNARNIRETNNNDRANAYIDRTILAQHIASLVTQLPGVNDATVLVTDDHVFIGLDEPKGKALDPDTVKEARRTAMSATPRYYRIHVTRDSNLRNRIDRIGVQMQNGRNTDGVSVNRNLEKLLRDLGDTSPPELDRNPPTR